MATREEIEKVRQEIMRYRELLDMMRANLDDGERAYNKLFENLSAEAMANPKEKDRQWSAAEQLVADVSPLGRAAMNMRFNAHELDRAFEELYDVIQTVHEADEEE